MSHQLHCPLAIPLTQPQKRGDAFPFHSILFDESEIFDESKIRTEMDGQEAFEVFTDLKLDQIIASITSGRDEYNLKPFFYGRLSHVEAIHYRHDILRDLENQPLFGHIQSFAQEMRTMRGHLAQADKSRYKYQKQSWFLEAANIYCDAVTRLFRNLTITEIRSRGFLAFRECLMSYNESNDFTALVAETQTLKADLSGVRYCLHVDGSRVTVSRYESQPDYSLEVLQTFEKFKQEASKEYKFDFYAEADMNHVETAVLDLVAQLHPEVFSSLNDFCSRRSGYLNDTISSFDREVQFYIACLEHVERFKPAGLLFCYPIVSDRSKEVSGGDVFDLALADRLIRENSPVVTNNFYLSSPGRIFIVSGPNQGGKTTFARTFGQIHYLASIGCPVPGRDASLFLFDQLFTHFDREEDIRNQSGKLEDELFRIHRILERATSNSILIMNESFASTTLNDALFLNGQVMRRIIQRDMLCVSVTFLDELALLSEATVSMVSTVDPRDPALRTFKVVRKPGDGLAYAVAIAEKYRLTYAHLKKRIAL